jgi:hypothetical protein
MTQGGRAELQCQKRLWTVDSREMQDRLGTAQRWGFWLWLVTSGLCVASVFGLLRVEEEREAGLLALGVVFAAGVVGFAILAQRAVIGAAVVGLWGLGFGVWFPEWMEAIGPVIRHWMVGWGIADAKTAREVTLPAAIASAGVTTAALMYVMTRSGRVVVQVALLSGIVALTALLPVHRELAVMGGIIAWHVAAAGSLFCWMSESIRSGSGLACASCGFDLLGLSSPVCPGCGHSLQKRAAVSRRAPVAAPAAVGRWY